MSDPRLPPRSFAIIFGVSITTAIGNTGMQSVLPAIGRQIGFPDFLVAAIFSLSALLWALSSPFWAARSDRSGRKPMMVVGLTGFMVSMVCCGAVVEAGVRHLGPPLLIFVLFLLSRALFGLFGAASNPASQAYVADRTDREARTGAMAGLAGAFGLGTIIGPAIAPIFVLPVVGLAGPMFAFALIAAAMVYVVLRHLPEAHRTPGSPAPAPPPEPGAARRRPLLRDPRLTPFLVYGFLVAAAQTAQGQTLGFLIIDKLHMPPMQAQGYTAVAMMAGAIAGLLAQWGLIRMFRMAPRDLLRWGAGLAAIANLIVAFAPNYSGVVLGYAFSSLGYGFCRPGFTAGASLAVSQAEQGRAAGAIAAVNGLNVVVAPLFVLLYGAWRPAPFLINSLVLAGLLAFAVLNGVLARAGAAPTTEDETARSSLERDQEGVSV
jgi:MFS family permease